MGILESLGLGNIGILQNLGSMWKYAIILILGFFAYQYKKRKDEEKLYTIDVSVHKKVGDGIVNLDKIAKQVKDETGVIRFTSKDGEIDEPGFDSRYFVMSGKGAGRRHIILFNPLPDVFVPYDYEHMALFNAPIRLGNEQNGDLRKCVYCSYITQLKEKGQKLDRNMFKTKAFETFVKTKAEDGDLIICKEHSTKYYTSKFKVLSETSIGWKLSKMKQRLLRQISKKSWYDNPLVTQGLMMAVLLAFVVLVLKFGPQWLEAETKEIAVGVAKEVGVVLREQLQNVTAPVRG